MSGRCAQVISDTQIADLLRVHNTVIPGIDESHAMQRLAKLWFSLLPTEIQLQADKAFKNDLTSSEITANFDVNGKPDGILACWVLIFMSPVIVATMYRIIEIEKDCNLLGEGAHFALESVKAERDLALQPFDSARLAVVKLREAAELCGLPRDYYVSRSVGFKERVNIASAIGNSTHKSIPFTRRPPIIETSNEFDDDQNIVSSQNDIVIAATIIDWYNEDFEYLAKGGKKSLEQWAIRKLWNGITIAFAPVGGTGQIDNHWAMVRDVLKLCNVPVDTEVVRRSFHSKRSDSGSS